MGVFLLMRAGFTVGEMKIPAQTQPGGHKCGIWPIHPPVFSGHRAPAILQVEKGQKSTQF